MTREQALNYLKSSGFSEEQIQAIVEALSGSENFSSGTRKNSQMQVLLLIGIIVIHPNS